MVRKYFLALFIIVGIAGCKTASLLTDYGIEKGDEYASIAVLPDTQYYTALRHGGTMKMFENQVDWILKNYKKEKIAYVIHLGDITDHNAPAEWERAKEQMYRLDATGVPYGLAVGNHDQSPNGTPALSSDTTQYARYFGRNHFGNRSWFGGALSSNSNTEAHFDIFSANGEKYMVVYFPYNQPGSKGFHAGYEKTVLKWADSVLSVHPDRKAILVSHSMLSRPKVTTSGDKPGMGDNSSESNFTKQGQSIYEMAKKHSNVFLMLGGHIAGEGFRKDTYNGNIIKTYLQDYQSRQSPPYGGSKDRNGGSGTMRLMRLNKTKQTLSVLTFTPQANGSVIKEQDGDSEFTHGLYN
ncbi:metallophosphoesterase [Niabella insulamsoli]|uniref:metallophosphoesterase n=1 Tax=Niabella insulamsoli TaxID=3144874 RepID=UPI0031FBABA2